MASVSSPNRQRRSQIAAEPTPVRFRRDRMPFVVLITLGLLGMALLAIKLTLAELPEAKDVDLTFEMARAAIQLMVVVVLGGLVTFLFGVINAQRDQRRARHELQFSSWGELMEADRDITLVRRNFRAAGLERGSANPQQKDLQVEQINVLRGGMQSLLKANLAIEQVLKGIDARPIFDEWEDIFRKLEIVHRYHSAISKEWQEHGWKFYVAENVAVRKLDDLERLQEFLKSPRPRFPQEALERVMYLYREELIKSL